MKSAGSKHPRPSIVALYAPEPMDGENPEETAPVGVRIRRFSDPENLIRAARTGELGLVAVDATTFGWEGVPVVERLKRDPGTRGIPLVAFGDSLRADLLQDAIESGADLVLPRAAFRKQWPGILSRFLGDRVRGRP